MGTARVRRLGVCFSIFFGVIAGRHAGAAVSISAVDDATGLNTIQFNPSVGYVDLRVFVNAPSINFESTSYKLQQTSGPLNNVWKITSRTYPVTGFSPTETNDSVALSASNAALNPANGVDLGGTFSPNFTGNVTIAKYRLELNPSAFATQGTYLIEFTGIGVPSYPVYFTFDNNPGFNDLTYDQLNSVSITVPEPAGMGLLVLGAGVLGLRRRR